MNAQDMYKVINTPGVCEGLDEWLQNVLLERMKNSSDLTVSMSISSVPYNQACFTREMVGLGYNIVTGCDDRPCAQPYYKISIKMPSQPGL